LVQSGTKKKETKNKIENTQNFGELKKIEPATGGDPLPLNAVPGERISEVMVRVLDDETETNEMC
jgi:hypothetical protein